MNMSQASKKFLSLTKEYFQGKTVIFANQSRAPMPSVPLVTLMTGGAKRPLFPPISTVNDNLTTFYSTSTEVTVDLFTNGTPVLHDGVEIAKEDTAVDEMLRFKDFLESEYVVDWCTENDVYIGFNGDVTSLTGIINDSTYQFRSRLVVILYFTHRTTGEKSVSAD